MSVFKEMKVLTLTGSFVNKNFTDLNREKGSEDRKKEGWEQQFIIDQDFFFG